MQPPRLVLHCNQIWTQFIIPLAPTCPQCGKKNWVIFPKMAYLGLSLYFFSSKGTGGGNRDMIRVPLLALITLNAALV